MSVRERARRRRNRGQIALDERLVQCGGVAHDFIASWS
jgi:hypothetical protein